MNVTLMGFMGSGKTTVGRILATRLGWDFVDTDRLIEERTGLAIPEIFATRGEAGFRELETDVIREVSRGDRQVISTGGGAVLEPANRLALRMAGVVVHLKASPELLWRRVSGSDRPLAQDPLAFRERYQERQPLYQLLPLQITSSGSAARVAERILEGIRGERHRIEVPIPEREYPIHLEPNAIAKLGALMAERLSPGRCLVVTNPHLEARYGDLARASLEAAGWEPTFAVVPAGERFKRMPSAMQLYDRALEARLERQNPVIALGGGVIGDLAGFVAATFNRGVPFVQVPTTLLAQIDSSVGGKVAVNHPMGKNLIGAFYQPTMVIADPLTLHTLPRRELLAGLAEMIKYGVIMDAAFFETLEADLPLLLERRMQAMIPAIARCCELKAEVVLEDERESGRRAILNFGHTLGHALEAETQYQNYLHGEAVAIGMVAAGAIARELGLFSDAEQGRMIALLERAGLPTRFPPISAQRLLEATGHDKKVQAGKVRWVLPESLGQVCVRSDVPPEVVTKVLHRLGAV
ncbi:3-dehydroquinate synthase [compost metagenome]